MAAAVRFSYNLNAKIKKGEIYYLNKRGTGDKLENKQGRQNTECLFIH